MHPPGATCWTTPNRRSRATPGLPTEYLPAYIISVLLAGLQTGKAQCGSVQESEQLDFLSESASR